MKKKGIGSDSTNVNNGLEGDFMHWIEVKFCRKLLWLVYALHVNELHLRLFIKALDEMTLSNNT